jgi:hypothetical protein
MSTTFSQGFFYNMMPESPSLEDLVREVGASLPPVPAPVPAPAPKQIPSRCTYSTRKTIRWAPQIPLSARTAKDHPDMLEKAQQKIRSYVCRNFKDWPACPCTNRNVGLDYDYGFDPKLGDVLIGYFLCEDCSK